MQVWFMNDMHNMFGLMYSFIMIVLSIINDRNSEWEARAFQGVRAAHIRYYYLITIF